MPVPDGQNCGNCDAWVADLSHRPAFRGNCQLYPLAQITQATYWCRQWQAAGAPPDIKAVKVREGAPVTRPKPRAGAEPQPAGDE